MKPMKRKLTALLIALMLLLSAAGCATTVVYTSGEEPGETLTLTDGVWTRITRPVVINGS